MKTNIIYGIAIALFISLCFTSCQKDEILSNTQDNVHEAQIDQDNEVENPILGKDKGELINLLPPKGFEEKSNLEKENFLANPSDEDLKKMNENHRVANFLLSIGKYDEVDQKLQKGEMFSDFNLTAELSESQLRELGNYEYSLESRCNYYHTGYCIWVGWPCYYEGWRIYYAQYCNGRFTSYGYFCSDYC